jgi:hypothetical protein
MGTRGLVAGSAVRSLVESESGRNAPAIYGWRPTLRIADFEVKAWILATGAGARIADLSTRQAPLARSPLAAQSCKGIWSILGPTGDQVRDLMLILRPNLPISRQSAMRLVGQLSNPSSSLKAILGARPGDSS